MHLAGPDLLDLPGQRRQRHLHVVRAHVLPGVRRAGEARQGGLPHLQEEDRQRHQDVLELTGNHQTISRFGFIFLLKLRSYTMYDSIRLLFLNMKITTI